MTRAMKSDAGKRVLAILVAIAVVLAFSPLASTTAHAASKAKKITLYKGQRIPVTIRAINKVTFTSDKSKVVQIKKGKKKGSTYGFTIVAKKAGKATLTSKAKSYKTEKYAVTVKSSYPVGSIKKPLELGGSKSIKSVDKKKQINVATTVWAGADARAQILALEQAATDGTSFFDKYYYNDPSVSAGRTLYLIKIDYNVVKGYPAGSGAYLSNLVGSALYDSKWRQLTSGTDYSIYYVNKVDNYVSQAPNGTAGTYYTAIFLNSSIKELRSEYAGNIKEYQEITGFGTNYELPISGCVSQKLP
ncbi:MAG: hypothetical protein LBG82_02560 [Clostridiales Family XIII bacterium]|nr:hypothetical protein [Clostridiales Family XIII bacterium]